MEYQVAHHGMMIDYSNGVQVQTAKLEAVTNAVVTALVRNFMVSGKRCALADDQYFVTGPVSAAASLLVGIYR